MQVDFEILIVLNVALFFTIITIVLQARKDKSCLVFSVLTAIAWFILALGYIGADPNFPAYAYLFLAVGIVFVVNTIIVSANMMGEQKAWR